MYWYNAVGVSRSRIYICNNWNLFRHRCGRRCVCCPAFALGMQLPTRKCEKPSRSVGALFANSGATCTRMAPSGRRVRFVDPSVSTRPTAGGWPLDRGGASVSDRVAQVRIRARARQQQATAPPLGRPSNGTGSRSSRSIRRTRRVSGRLERLPSYFTPAPVCQRAKA